MLQLKFRSIEIQQRIDNELAAIWGKLADSTDNSQIRFRSWIHKHLTRKDKKVLEIPDYDRPTLVVYLGNSLIRYEVFYHARPPKWLETLRLTVDDIVSAPSFETKAEVDQNLKYHGPRGEGNYTNNTDY